MTRWEYCIVYRTTFVNAESVLTQKGMEGWELVSATKELLFKRPINEQPSIAVPGTPQVSMQCAACQSMDTSGWAGQEGTSSFWTVHCRACDYHVKYGVGMYGVTSVYGQFVYPQEQGVPA